MPLYEYLCSACAHQFERIVKFSDAPVTTCPKCGKETLDQMISAPAVQFKGSGWYVTDYAKKSSGGLGASSRAENGSSDSAKLNSQSSGGESASAGSGGSEKSSSSSDGGSNGSSGSSSSGGPSGSSGDSSSGSSSSGSSNNGSSAKSSDSGSTSNK